MVNLLPTQRPQTQRVLRPAAPAGKASPTKSAKPAAEQHAEQTAEQQPGCFAQAFNKAFVAVMTKLFGRQR